MSFSYSINTGRLGADDYHHTLKTDTQVKNDDLQYLADVFGFNVDQASDSDDFTENKLYVDNYEQLAQEWKNAFSDPLYYSQGIHLFENDGVDQITKLLNNQDTIQFDANSDICRIEMYKEMFKQNYYATSVYEGLNGTNPSVTNSSVNFASANYLNSAYDDTITGLNNTVLGRNQTGDFDAAGNDVADLLTLYQQLENEATKLKATLVDDSVSVGGAPELPYSSMEAEIYLLQKEMDRELTNFIRLYDDLEAVYRANIGEDGSYGDADAAAFTAASMTAEMAIDYATKYHKSNMPSDYGSFVFTNASLNEPTYYEGGMGYELELYEKLVPYSNDASTDNNFEALEIDTKVKMNNDLNVLIANGDTVSNLIKDLFGVNGVTTDIGTPDMSESAHYLGSAIFKSAQKLVEMKTQIAEKTLVASINNEVRAEYEARLGAMEAINEMVEKYDDGCLDGIDPYLVNINGVDYVMGKDSNEDGVINSIVEILGINDTKDDLFKSVKELDIDNDGYVSQEEMQARNVIFNAVDENGQLTGETFATDKVGGIDLSTFEAADGTDNVFGTFTVDLSTAKANARQTFESKEYFNNLFGEEVDFSILNTEETLDVTSSEEEIFIPEAKTQEDPVAEESAETSNNYSFSLESSDKSQMEKILDKLSWELGVKHLSPAQKIRILDSIDESQDVDIIEAKLTEKLDSINLSA